VVSSGGLESSHDITVEAPIVSPISEPELAEILEHVGALVRLLPNQFLIGLAVGLALPPPLEVHCALRLLVHRLRAFRKQ